MSNFKYVSLFSGVGGFDLPLNWLGGECVLASEIDKFARKSYEAMFGEIPEGDVTKIPGEEIPDHNVLVAGFPCPTYSVAGGRAGMYYVCTECSEKDIVTYENYVKEETVCTKCGSDMEPEDERGLLFFEIARFADYKQPQVVIMENVKGLISANKGKALDTIVETMSALGYQVDFEVLNSKYFGVPQARERVFIVAIREDLVEEDEWETKGSNVVAKAKRRIAGQPWAKTFNFRWPAQDEVTTVLTDILEDEVDERYYLSEEKTEALLAQLREDNEPLDEGQTRPVLTPDRVNKRQNGRRFKDNGEEAFTLTSQDRHGVLQTDSPHMVGHIDLKGHDAIKRVYNPDCVGPTLTTMGGGHREPKIVDFRVAVVNQDGELRELEDGTTTCLDANYSKGMDKHGQRTHVLEGLAIREATEQGYAVAFPGDAVNFQFPTSKTRRGRVGHQIAKTLEASGCNQGVVTIELDIRKLTPRECFRLQGFPDSEFDKLVEAGVSNTQLYKQSGNAVTVDVVHALMCNVLPYIEGQA